MLWKTAGVILAFAYLFCMPSSFLATAQAADEISITKASSPAKGDILGEGTYKLDAGHSVKQIIMLIYNEADTELLHSVTADYDKKKLTWKGLKIGLTSGTTYQVRASMVVDEGGGLENTVITPTKIEVKVK